ncbi:CDP-diacylglycerol--glycerol-3-phosphate 3-phosphatidyltransferase [Candidatus Dependentiae bacterium]|nr:MAG: CDP-diacylglycerol--glycerol-3-phosphate 3-phosphatidyltransferase [Candidatus Dependentiae bacterium]
MNGFIKLPTILTLIRLIISPIMLPILLVYFLPLNQLWINSILAALFLLFSLTDFFDGYLARKYRQVTALGRVLDPIADKCLTYSVLIALLAIHKIFFVWVIILIGRDFFMMGLRQVALEHNFRVPVSLLGKIKTVVQLSFLAMLILNPYHSLQDNVLAGWIADFWRAPRWMVIEGVLLTATITFAFLSMRGYYRSFIEQFLQHQASGEKIPEKDDLEV